MHRLDIVETREHDDDYETLPFVRPGGFIMLSLNTVERVDEALRIIDLIEFGGVPLTEVPARYWLELDSSLKCNKKPPTYTLQDHQELLKKTKELS